MKPTDPSSFVLQLIPSPGGNIIPDGILGPISTLGDLFSGALDVFFDFLLAPIKIILFIFFAILLEASSILYQVLLIVVTRAPVPEDSDGNAVIFGTPGENNSFYGMQQVMEGAIEPMAVVMVLIGIAIILFFRVFDVVMNFSFDSEGAQKRLLMAPLLIFLWIPIANLILILASGLTDFFLNGINPDYGTVVDGSREYVSESTNADGETEYNVTIRSILETAAGVGDQGLGQGALQNFFGGSGGSGSLEQIIDLSMAIIFMVAGMPAILFGLILGLLRFFLLYMAYVLGPIAIALWAFKWKNIGSVGEKVIRGFILLALFPIPAALVDLLLPILTVSMEQATTSAATDLGGGTAGEETIQSVVRYSIGMTAPILVAFTPWILVVGFNKAAAGAGLAAGAGGILAGQAVGAGASGATSVASSYKKGGGSVKSSFKQAYQEKDSIRGAALSGTAKVGSDAYSGAKNAPSKATEVAKVGKDVVSEKADKYKERENRDQLYSKALGGAGKKLERHGGGAGTALGSAMKGAGQGYEKETKREAQYKSKRQKVMDKEERKQAATEANISEDEMEVAERAMASNMNPDYIDEVLERSDSNIKKSEVMENGELTNDGQEVVGHLIGNELREKSREELENQYGKSVSKEMRTSAKDLSHRDYRNASKKAGRRIKRKYAVNMDDLDDYEGNISPAVNTPNGRMQVHDEYDPELANRAEDEVKDRLSEVADGREQNLLNALYGNSQYNGSAEDLGQQVVDNMEGIDKDDVMVEGEDGDEFSKGQIISQLDEKLKQDVDGWSDAKSKDRMEDIPMDDTIEKLSVDDNNNVRIDKDNIQTERTDVVSERAGQIMDEKGIEEAHQYVNRELEKLVQEEFEFASEKLEEKGVEFNPDSLRNEIEDTIGVSGVVEGETAENLASMAEHAEESVAGELAKEYQTKLAETIDNREISAETIENAEISDLENIKDLEHIGKMAEDFESGLAEFITEAQDDVAKQLIEDIDADIDAESLVDEANEYGSQRVEEMLMTKDFGDIDGVDKEIQENILESDAINIDK